MRRFLGTIMLAEMYCSMLEEQEFTDVELFSQCTDTDFADLGAPSALISPTLTLMHLSTLMTWAVAAMEAATGLKDTLTDSAACRDGC